MGILDDAIREHLDLKRKHGAAEDELQRQEEEALGPARREVAPAQAQDTNGAGESAAAEASPDEADEPAGETQAAEPSAEPAEAHTDPAIEAAPAPAVEEPQPEPLPPEPDPEPVATEPEPPAPEPVAAEPEPEPPPVEAPYDAASHEEPSVPAGDTPPRGFETLDEEVDELFADERAPESKEGGEGEKDEDEDVLEDTPDFLQETPEHDRLWFEQKPPRDFDFD
jgi:hypothetical protein